MILKITGTIVVVICGIASFFAKKVLPAITKREPSEQNIISFKLCMLAAVAVGAALVILPDYM